MSAGVELLSASINVIQYSMSRKNKMSVNRIGYTRHRESSGHIVEQRLGNLVCR